VSNGKRLVAGAAVVAIISLVSIAAIQARAVDRKAARIHPGMTLAEVLTQLDGWRMINAHPVYRRAIPHGTGPEFNGYSGQVYILTPVRPNGSETDLRTISRAEFERRLESLLGGGEPWTVYFSFRTFPTDRGTLVRFDGEGKVAAGAGTGGLR
jgi:hypothetical protein